MKKKSTNILTKKSYKLVFHAKNMMFFHPKQCLFSKNDYISRQIYNVIYLYQSFQKMSKKPEEYMILTHIMQIYGSFFSIHPSFNLVVDSGL